MRFAAVLLVAFACVSSAGAEVAWTNLVVELPGLTTEPFLTIGSDCPSIRCNWIDGSNRGADGSTYFVRDHEVVVPGSSCYMGTLFRQEILRTRSDGTSERIAYIDEQCGCGSWPEQVHPQISLDQTGGFIYVRFHYFNHNGCCCNLDDYEVIRIRGLETLYEIQQSYTPQPATLGFRVPYMPEGMPGVDHFDTYWGSLSHPLDFTNAQPLACNYPATAPHVGDYLTVADTVPTLMPGQGVYYVTAATYQGATRYGRKTSAGHLSGRDPAVLPACTP